MGEGSRVPSRAGSGWVRGGGRICGRVWAVTTLGELLQPHLWVFPQPPSPDELPANVKQAYRAFAAVPTVHPPENSATQVCAVYPAAAVCSIEWVPKVSAPR